MKRNELYIIHLKLFHFGQPAARPKLLPHCGKFSTFSHIWSEIQAGFWGSFLYCGGFPTPQVTCQGPSKSSHFAYVYTVFHLFEPWKTPLATTEPGG